MWVSYEKAGIPALINLDKVTAITLTANKLMFLGEIIMKGQPIVNGQRMDVFGNCILDEITFESVDEAAKAYAEISRAISRSMPIAYIFNMMSAEIPERTDYMKPPPPSKPD